MGLAASQAKLLSITSRISQNELRAQSITTAKTALANETAELNKKYLKSLNQQELLFSTYNENGEQTFVPLTGAELTTYSPIKNQYGLINPAGQILVSEKDAKNYEESANINEFLAKYGVDEIPTGQYRTVINPEYEAEYAQWKKLHDEWLAAKEDENIKVIDREEGYDETVDTDNELYKTFLRASKPCYDNAIKDETQSGCYMHVLAHCLYLSLVENYQDCEYPYEVFDKSKYPVNLTTTTGDSVSVSYRHMSGSNINTSWETPNMVPISEAICDNYKGKTLMATANSEIVSRFDLTDADKTGNMNDPEYKKKRLLSNYTIDESGNIVLKTLEQKCTDMFYLIEALDLGVTQQYRRLGISYDPDMKDLILSFEEDMSLAFSEPQYHPEEYHYEHNPAYDEWLKKEPKMNDIPQTKEEEIYEYADSDKAQWYVNLWHRMNGESQEKDGYTTASFKTTNATSGIFTNQKRWDILEDGLMNNPKWLKYAFETCAITLERVNYANPTEAGTGIKKAQWVSTIYTNANDIAYQTNTKAIAESESEFEQKQKVLEAKDKQYDSILKLLDTEHNTLQTEYDSVKSVIQKNTERTLKIYSA